MNAGDDQVSGWSPDFGFNFDIWGNSYSKAKMSTNGCVNFSGLNCSDYTPQPLPYKDETLYPFWTDLIRNNSSKMLFKSFDDYVVFGWYGMKEYSYPNHRGNNNFEAILWANDTYEYRYGALDITKHDVLIGEQQSSSLHKTFRYFDDGTGGHNNWDSFDASFSGNVLEGGGSLYSGSLTDMCNANQLYSPSCSGYAAAYLAQQCGISALYNSSCSGYAAAYLAQQCGINVLYDSNCSGYAVAYLSQQCGLDATYDSSCDGYWEATFVATVTEDYSDVVFGDEVSDYYFVDDDELTDYYEIDVVADDIDYGDVDTTYGGPTVDDNPGMEEPEPIYVVVVEEAEEVFVALEPDPIIEEIFEEELIVIVEVFEEEIEEIFEVVELEAPIEVIAVVEEVIPEIKEPERVAVDITKLALSIVAETSAMPMMLAQSTVSQTDIQQSMNTGSSTDVFGDTGFFYSEIEVIEDIVSSGPVQNFNQVVTQSSEETSTEEVEIMQELTTSVTEMKFEEDFNDAIATGQSIGQFLSNQLPDFGQFNVAPPSVDESRTVQRAESALQTMTDEEIEQSIESQLENVQDSGGFEDQTLTILLMSRVPGFDVYGLELQDQGQWYQEREIYGGNRPVDGNIRAFQGQGAQTFQDLVGQQYER
tara:strand:+ start:14 stop:1954 length:1941 start_codon:yes stop_codon:yes gene_type:complete